MRLIADLIGFVLGKIVAALEWIGELAVAVFVALWDMGKDAVCWVLESFLRIATSALQALDLGPITSQLGVWGSIPANVLEVMSALGLGTAFGIITAAIGVRMLLQLIPFVRLGS